jgi:hypothetical protein
MSQVVGMMTAPNLTNLIGVRFLLRSNYLQVGMTKDDFEALKSLWVKSIATSAPPSPDKLVYQGVCSITQQTYCLRGSEISGIHSFPIQDMLMQMGATNVPHFGIGASGQIRPPLGR